MKSTFSLFFSKTKSRIIQILTQFLEIIAPICFQCTSRIKQRNGGKSWLFQERKNKEYSKGWRWAVCGNNGRCCRRRSKAFLCCNVHRKCFKYIHMPESSSSQMKRKENDEENEYTIYIKKYIYVCGWRSFPSARKWVKEAKRNLPMHSMSVSLYVYVCVCASILFLRICVYVCAGKDNRRQCTQARM